MNVDLNRTYDFAKYIRTKTIEMALNCGKAGCHIGGSLSCVEILAVLYGHFLHYNPQNPTDIHRDRFFASKAHCAPSLYAALAKAGFVAESDLAIYRVDGGLLTGYPFNLQIGLEFTGGSLGMGLSLGVGVALSARRKGLAYKSVVLLGDGECNEGSIWEALMSAAQFQLDNLVVIVDYNNMQYDGKSTEIMSLENFEAKLNAFGCNTQVVDGHSIEALIAAFSVQTKNQPLAVIAKTIKAKGIQRLEDTAESHFTFITQEDYDLAMAEIEKGKYDRV